MEPVRPKEIEIFKGRNNLQITGDARFFPLLIVHTVGDVDIPTYDAFFEWRTQWADYAATKGTKVIQISLNDEGLKPPSATVRKHMAERAKNDDNLPGWAGTYMVVPSALIRGVVTAVMWVAGSSLNIKNFPTLTEAAMAAHREFENMGLEYPPFDAAHYVVPS